MSTTTINAVKGVTLHVPLTVKDSSRELANADSTPTITAMFVNGTAVDPATHSATIAQQRDTSNATITGRYFISVDTSNLSIGDNYVINSRATVDGVSVDAEDTGRILDPNEGSIPTLE